MAEKSMKRTLLIVSCIVLMLSVAGRLPAQTARKTIGAGRGRSTSTASRRSLMRPASLNQRAPAVYRARFTSTQGDFVIEVTRAWAPLGADRFYNLVKNGFFTDASFFRVVPGFVVQFGIPAKPEIGKAWAHATIKDDPVVQSNTAGTVTFATGGPDTRSSQVFINLRDNSNLDGQGFSAFGKVTDGMDVVEKLYSGYGDGPPFGNGPDQGRLTNEGKAYLDKNFPRLDSIKSAVVVKSPAAAAGTAPKK
jgi:cyclophilin family peptidyl-prolyl cis-trans isomerase